MEPITSNASEAKTSARNTEIATGLLQLPGKQRGKGAGKGKLGPADLAGLSTFAGMLKLASRKSVPGMTKGFLPVGENTVSTGKSPLKSGNRKTAALADGKSPVEGSVGINLFALLTGLGIQKEQAEKIIQELEGTLSRAAGASAMEKGKAGEKIAALLAGYGFTDEKIQGILSALADGKLVPPGSLPGQRGVQQKETGAVTATAARTGGASGAVVLGGIVEKFSLPPDGLADGRETKKGKEEGATIKAASGDKEQNLSPRPVHAPAAERGMALETEGAVGGDASSKISGDRGNEARAAGTADTGAAAARQGGVFPLREGLAKKEPPQMNAALTVTEAGAGKDAAIAEQSLAAGKVAPTDGKEAGNARIRTKQRPAAFKEQIAGAQQGRDRLPDETAAAGKTGGDAQRVETAGKKPGKEDAGDRIISVRGPAGESTAAGRGEQGNLFAVSGGANDRKAETAPGLRPEVVIDQIVAQAGQFPQNAPGRIKITLNPPHLGTLDMDVLIRNNKVEVVLIASSQEVQQVLKAHGDQLKNALQGQGLKVDGFDVMLQGNQSGPEYRFHEGNFAHDGRGEDSGSRGDAAAAVSPAGIVSPSQGRGAENGDGISLFV